MKPIIVYVDDEPNNLVIFEASMSPDWEVRSFVSPTKALECLSCLVPSVLVADQRMPEMNGVEFLVAAGKLHPEAIRIIVTGYSDEHLMIQSVRSAQVFDYIRKPWESRDLEASVRRAIDLFRSKEERRAQQLRLAEREAMLSCQNQELIAKVGALENDYLASSEAIQELECWVPPALVAMVRNKTVTFPLTRDIVMISFGMTGSAGVSDVMINKRSLREHFYRLFSQCVHRQGGWHESHSGESAYGYFGLWGSRANPHQAALAAAQDFQMMFTGLCRVNGVSVDFGIGLHLARKTTVNILVHEVQISMDRGPFVTKSFDTHSSEVDLLHRIKQVANRVPGSNLIMSGDFVAGLEQKPAQLLGLGSVLLHGQFKPTELFLVASNGVTESDLARLRAELAETGQLIPLAA